jgi:plastocyanin
MRRVFVGLMAAAAVATLPVAPAAASGGGGCGEPVTDGTGSTVAIRGYCFRPTVLHAKPGVQSSTYRFSEPGIYPFVCVWHPGMVGAVWIGGGDASTAAAFSGGRQVGELGPRATTSSPWKAVAVAAAGMLLLVVVGTAEHRRRAAA